MAQSGPAACCGYCPLMGVEQTLRNFASFPRGQFFSSFRRRFLLAARADQRSNFLTVLFKGERRAKRDCEVV